MAYPARLPFEPILLALACTAPLLLACGDPKGDPDDATATDPDGGNATEAADGSGSADGADGMDEGSGSGGEPEPTPAECGQGDGISAAFSVDDHDWPEAAEFGIELDVECTIADMGDLDGESIAPTLECEVDGMLRSVAITMNDPGFQTSDGHALLPAFDVGEVVRFRHRGVEDAGGLVDGVDGQRSHYYLESFSLHASDGRLLAAGFSDWGMDDDMHAPVVITENDTFCGESQPFPDDPERPILMTFALDDASLSLVGGHAGLLDTGGGFGDEGIGIVAAQAIAGGCCHTNRQYQVLMVALHQGEG